jgi:hypothetical protein
MASCDELFATMYDRHDRMLGLMAECLRLMEKMTTPPSPEMKEEDSTVTTTKETIDDVPDEQLHPVAVSWAQIHLSIDSTDEVDPDLNFIKVCGGRPLREKMNKAAGNSFIVFVDRYKPVPVEVVVILFTAEHTLALVGKVFDELPGSDKYVVVEHGMFTRKAPLATTVISFSIHQGACSSSAHKVLDARLHHRYARSSMPVQSSYHFKCLRHHLHCRLHHLLLC